MERRIFLAGLPALLMRPLEAMQSGAKEKQQEAFVRIPSGTFRMGFGSGLEDEAPEHEVRIGTAFEIAKFEVTQAQWEIVMRDPHYRAGKLSGLDPADTPVSASPSHFKGQDLPVESVSWDDVQIFLERLNSRQDEYRFRLPTEAEWEYACRGGAKAVGVLKDVADEAWYKGNAGGSTKSVGAKKPNHFGIYDMNGNVSEWVHDWYAADYYTGSPHADPKGPSSGSYRVFRGGAWLNEAELCRPTIRNFDFPNSRFYHVGFRLVRNPV